jgi:hypothetical protein
MWLSPSVLPFGWTKKKKNHSWGIWHRCNLIIIIIKLIRKMLHVVGMQRGIGGVGGSALRKAGFSGQ